MPLRTRHLGRALLLTIFAYLAYLYLFPVRYEAAGYALNPQTELAVSASRLKAIPIELIEHVSTTGDEPAWERMAYIQYATLQQYLCAAIMNFAALRNARTKCPNLVIYYSIDLTKRLRITDADTPQRRALRDLFKYQLELARIFDIQLIPVRFALVTGSNSNYMASTAKFLIFNCTEYDRVVYFDADAVIPSKAGTMDALFSLPKVDVAMPLAYWLVAKALQGTRPPLTAAKGPPPQRSSEEASLSAISRAANLTLLRQSPHLYESLPSIPHHKHFTFASHFIVATPNLSIFNALTTSRRWKKAHEYDMELFNKLFNPSHLASGASPYTSLVLPHQVYGGLTGEFRRDDHRVYMADAQDAERAISTNGYWSQWNATSALARLKLVHFSDAPYPKPWHTLLPESPFQLIRVECPGGKTYDDQAAMLGVLPTVIDDCLAAGVWNGLYERFRESMWLQCLLKPTMIV